MPLSLSISENILSLVEKVESYEQIKDSKEADSVGSSEEQEKQAEPEWILEDKYLYKDTQ